MNKLLYKLRLVVYVYVVCLAVLNPFLASAQTPVQPTQSENQLQSYSGVEATIEAYLCTPSENPDGFDLQRCINKLYRVGIAVGALVLVFLVVLAGYMYITGSEGGKKRAKELIVSALVGMAVLLSSFVILRFINPNLTTFRPIQPPIFTAADIPSCEAIGFEDDCKLPSGEVVTSSSTTGTKGQRVACPGGKLVKAKALAFSPPILRTNSVPVVIFPH